MNTMDILLLEEVGSKAQEWKDLVNSSPQYQSRIFSTLGMESGELENPIRVIVETVVKDSIPLICVYTFVDSRMCNGDKGPDVSWMGSVSLSGETTSPLFDFTLKRLIPVCKKFEYTGALSVEVECSKEKIIVASMHVGFRVESIFSLLEMVNYTPESFISQASSGRIESVKFKSSLGISVPVFVLPFPILECTCREYVRPTLEFVSPQNSRHFFAEQVVEGDGRPLGTAGRLGVFTARGDVVGSFSALRDARRRVYRTLNNIGNKDLIYRDDVGYNYEHSFSQLQSWGLI